MSDPLGMKAHCSDKRLIQSSLHHIHTPCSLIHPHTPISNPKSTQFSIYQIICSPLNTSSTKSLLWQTFPKGFHKQGHSVFLVHGPVVLSDRRYLPSYEIFWAAHLKKWTVPASLPVCFVVPGGVICTWLAEPVREWHPAKHTQASPVVCEEEKTTTTDL